MLATLFSLVPELIAAHRSLVAALEKFAAGGSMRASFSSAADGACRGRLAPLLSSFVPRLEELYTRYAQVWALEAEHALRTLEAEPACASMIGVSPPAACDDDGAAAAAPACQGDEGAGAGAGSKLRTLLELPLDRITTYESTSVEMQLATQPSDPGWAAVVALLESLTSLAQRMGEQQQELARRSALRAVVARFKPGEVDELLDLDGPRRTLVHAAPVTKASKLGKLVRHCAPPPAPSCLRAIGPARRGFGR